ncbi:dihydropteroate synthase [Kineosporia sp. J2-2]|uniref:Dihydropteroate synthase n=1 Tax=Kineosporia corallincola TaxID=2835133 RepID=A0ABS5TH49_9ACTN|nr:dihydropteroate synthase [Kineosporia corallincola]MBT0770415.1 dihydropteroate synthase [Kineosporia corallincola]
MTVPPPSARLRLGGRDFAPGVPVVMAVINRTPDSFYAGNRMYDEDAAAEAVARAEAEGADIVDVGGVKAGPGTEVDTAEELRRVVPFIARIRSAHPGLLLSVDTWRAEVARQACAAGADLINDTWAGHDPQLPAIAAAAGAGLVLSHTGGAVPRTRPHRVGYGNGAESIVDDVLTHLMGSARTATDAGVPGESLLLDPTHDFGKNTWHGLALLRRTEALVALGHPVLMSLSRKDFVGETLDLPVDDRLEGTLAATAVAAWCGAKVFRVHDVAASRRAIDMVASIRGERPPARAVRGLA